MPEKREQTRGISRIQHIDIHADIGQAVAHAFFDLPDDPARTELVEVPGRNDREAALQIVADVSFSSDERGADASVD